MELLVGNGAVTSPVPYTGGVTAAGTETPAPAAEAPALNMPLAAAIVIALLAAVLAACVTLLITRRRRQTPRVPEPLAAPAVGKLHAQGARSSQQDSFYVSPETLYPDRGVLAVVADGMGGLADGDRVSQEAVRSIMNRSFELSDTMPVEKRLLELLATANGSVNRLLGYDRIGRCGSTLLLGWLMGSEFHYLSVGDSRICLYRGGVLTQLNREHDYRRELELRAVNGDGTFEDADSHPRASGLTSYLGMGQLKYVDIPAEPITVLPGDRIILMSDGVYNALTPVELSECLSLDAQAAADAIGTAIEGHAWPGQDNYTAVIIQC